MTHRQGFPAAPVPIPAPRIRLRGLGMPEWPAQPWADRFEKTAWNRAIIAKQNQCRCRAVGLRARFARRLDVSFNVVVAPWTDVDVDVPCTEEPSSRRRQLTYSHSRPASRAHESNGPRTDWQPVQKPMCLPAV